MQTTSEIVTRALRRIGVVATDEPATADQIRSGLDALNEIGQSFRVHGVMFDMPILGASTPLPIDNACLAAFQTILAARLAEEFTVPGPDPRPAWAQIAAFYYEVPSSDLHELTTTPSQRRNRAPINSPGFTGPVQTDPWDAGNPVYDVS